LVEVVQAGGDDFPAIDLERFKALGDGKINVLRINILRAGIDVSGAFGPNHNFAFARGGEDGWGHQYARSGGSAKGVSSVNMLRWMYAHVPLPPTLTVWVCPFSMSVRQTQAVTPSPSALMSQTVSLS